MLKVAKFKLLLKSAIYSKVGFILIGFILLILRVSNDRLLHGKIYNNNVKRLYSIFLRIGYHYNAISLKLLRAYKYRITHMYLISVGILSGNQNNANRYLIEIYDIALINKIGLDRIVESGIKKISKFKYYDTTNIKLDKTKVKKTIYIGPAADLGSIQLDSYDLIVLNKPVRLSPPFQNKSFVLILNNQWVIEKKDELLNWLSNYPNVTVISPQHIKQDLQRHEIFDLIPRYCEKASLMGLQRSLFILTELYEFESVDVQGFNFSLTHNPYKNWYPSLITKNFSGDLNVGIVRSNVVHDFVLNLSFTNRLLSKYGSINGEIRDILHRGVISNIEHFQGLYSRKSQFRRNK